MESVVKVLISIFIIGMVVLVIVFFSVFGLLPAEKLTEVFNPSNSTSTEPIILTSTTTIIERIIERVEVRDPEPEEPEEEPVTTPDDSPENNYDFVLEFQNGMFSPNQINLSYRDDVIIGLRSNDLNYQVSIPSLSLSQEASPGGTSLLAFQALERGTFEVYCEECIEGYVGIIIVE